MTRTVLMLGYFFPPLAGGGVQRTAKFVKYLPGQQWRPLVVSVQPNRRNSIEQGLDETLLPDAGHAAEVVRTSSFELASLYAVLHRLRLRKVLFEVERLVPFLHMDYKIGWYLPALAASREILGRQEVDLIYTTSPPYSAHFVGRRLKRVKGLPWVADFRDPWTQIAEYRPPTRVHALLERRLETAILRDADAVIANTEANRAALLRDFHLPSEKVHTIPNGFDPADFQVRAAPEPPGGSFVVLCAGKFYSMPNVSAFFHAFRGFAVSRPQAKLVLQGPLARNVHKAMSSILQEGTWFWAERVDHSAAVAMMMRAAVLLANVPGERAAHWVPGKLYEYLAAGRPILFIGPQDGEAARIVTATRTGIVVPEDQDRIRDALVMLHQAWSLGKPPWEPDWSAISAFDRSRQAAQLAAVFDKLLAVATRASDSFERRGYAG